MNEIIQDILVYATVFAAGVYTLYKLFRQFVPVKGKHGECQGGCQSCSLKQELLHDIKAAKKNS